MWRWLLALGCLGCAIDRTGGAPLDGDVGELDAGPTGIDAGPSGIDSGPAPADTGVDASVPPDSCRLVTFHRDADGDGRGDPASTMASCAMPPGYVTDATDCDDSCSVCFMGAAETCDGFDNDCNMAVDDGVGETFYADTDGDGYGDAGEPIVACAMPAGYVRDARDCDDGCARCRPGFPHEICGDARDNDCDAEVDETSCPCVWHPLSTGNYAVCPGRVTWFEARMRCADLDGRLASLETRAENDAVWGALDGYNQWFWAGGSDLATEGTWVWESGMALGTCGTGSCSSCPMCNWEPTQPNGGDPDDCLFIHRDWSGRWGDIHCETTFNGGMDTVCELL